MARTVQFRLNDALIAFDLGTKVDKRALYGFAQRIAEKDGMALSRGILTADGRLLPSHELSRQRVDPDGTPVEEPAATLNGQPATLLPSAFDEPASLEPAPLTTLAAFQVKDVYPLSGAEIAAGLYRTTFSYRKSYQHNDAIVLAREDQTFLLVGVTKRATMVGLSVAYDFFDADGEDEAEDGDELDFSMV